MGHIQFIFGSQQQLPERGCVATIGTFDGVHLGHQAILQRLVEVAKQRNLPSVVVVFEPQPHEYFAGDKAPARLMRLRDKVEALAHSGVDYVVCLKFDSQLSGLTAEQFIEQVLVHQLAVEHLEIGDDFRFGCDRQGDFRRLKLAGEQFGFSVCDTPTFLMDGERVSSTRIRALLESDHLQQAAVLLGTRYAISGRVVYGRQLGRQLGVPTANIGLGRFRSPVQGVYAVRIRQNRYGAVLTGVANVGVKPSIDGVRKPLLEVHIFDFAEQLYGKCLHVEFCEKLRNERKFESLDELKGAIASDIESGRAYFANTD